MGGISQPGRLRLTGPSSPNAEGLLPCEAVPAPGAPAVAPRRRRPRRRPACSPPPPWWPAGRRARPPPRPSGANGANTKVGVSVTGGFGEKPTLTIPTTPAPTRLSPPTCSSRGTAPPSSPARASSSTTWGRPGTPKDGKPTSSTTPTTGRRPRRRRSARGGHPGLEQDAGRPEGREPPAPDRPAGRRLRANKDPNQALAGHTLLFVVDVLGSYDEERPPRAPRRERSPRASRR